MSMESRLVAKYKINLGARTLLMVAGKVWYISRVTVFRLERLEIGYLFCNSPCKREIGRNGKMQLWADCVIN